MYIDLAKTFVLGRNQFEQWKQGYSYFNWNSSDVSGVPNSHSFNVNIRKYDNARR